MDHRELKKVLDELSGGIADEKEAITSTLEDEKNEEESDKPPLHPNEALELFLDRIPLSSIPGIHNATVLEIKSNDSIEVAITCLYKQNVMGAPVLDESASNQNPLTDRYIGLVEFAGMVLWVLEKFKLAESEIKSRGLAMSSNKSNFNIRTSDNTDQTNPAHYIEEIEEEGFFSMLKRLPNVGRAKVGEIARSFRWGPFLPVRLDDSLLHVLLLLSKHSLKAVPVVDPPDMHVKGFITQNAAVQILLQCSGLEWFDMIAQKTLFDFGFHKEQTSGQIVHLYGNYHVTDAIDSLWKHRISAVPVIDCKSKTILGHIRNTDMRLLLDNQRTFIQRRTMTIEEFLKIDDQHTESSPSSTNPMQTDFAALLSAGVLRLKNVSLPKMMDPPTSQVTDTLKMVMESVVQAKSDRSFLINENQELIGVVTLRDIIIQFSPPSLNPSSQFGGFFQSVLEQTGSTMEGGTIVSTS
ncbi:hypothetical protein SUGI_0343350 [Cryptomeria japonica]|uniref:SNF1-related protein kinase regulatory subunit gamma-1 n=1 Tax=Cryptomeria japonica TaxID=3369 RepID=UPI002408B206|nr:SNF1-related protein kinase regulatory subunit gamma-1 [Cryptomeria japonica]GLJ19117.1 hypothetical protein SUGI_0343350 [Cryptomeria japonica]